MGVYLDAVKDVNSRHPFDSASIERKASETSCRNRRAVYVVDVLPGSDGGCQQAEPEATRGFFQLHLPGDREPAASLINRAESSGYSALVLTVGS
jgi:isopentenyl diphosphate isomerase/L-lactate dehydrogenase-like FMN-dependent dehydrogenase